MSIPFSKSSVYNLRRLRIDKDDLGLNKKEENVNDDDDEEEVREGWSLFF